MGNEGDRRRRETLRTVATRYEKDVRRQVALWLDMAHRAAKGRIEPLAEADERIMSGGAKVYQDLYAILREIQQAHECQREGLRAIERARKLLRKDGVR